MNIQTSTYRLSLESVIGHYVSQGLQHDPQLDLERTLQEFRSFFMAQGMSVSLTEEIITKGRTQGLHEYAMGLTIPAGAAQIHPSANPAVIRAVRKLAKKNPIPWRVRFTDYLAFEGVKESIEVTKKKTKEQKKRFRRTGDMIEQAMKTIIEDGGVMQVDALPPQYDMGFGADYRLNYKKDEKCYSFFVDVTARVDADTRYFSLAGELVTKKEQAFCYYTDQFALYFSVKKNHYHFFHYEKPVVCLIVQTFGKDIDVEALELSHSTNISNILIALHEFMMDKEGYGARASHFVQPNKNKFYKQYNEYVKEVMPIQ